MSLTQPDNPGDQPTPPAAAADPAITRREWPEPWQSPYLAMLAQIPNVSAACRVAGVSRETAYQHRRSNPLFREAWDEARDIGLDQLERIAHRRATVGELRTVTRVTTKTDDVGNVIERTTVEETVNQVDNALLMRLLAGYRPQVWAAEVRHRHTGEEGGPIEVEVMRWPTTERAAELLRLHAEENGLQIIDGSLAEPPAANGAAPELEPAEEEAPDAG